MDTEKYEKGIKKSLPYPNPIVTINLSDFMSIYFCISMSTSVFFSLTTSVTFTTGCYDFVPCLILRIHF